MKYLVTVAAVCSLLIACKPQQDQSAQAPNAEPLATTAVRAPEVPTGNAFSTPLPQGVVLRQPYNARMDIAQENPNGSMGRRIEFEYLKGDATQAMAEFAESMAAAGFVSPEGPTIENGIVRQVFKKPGYGAAFARAQAEPAENHKNALARGFVVVAWPQGNGVSQAASK